MTAEVRAAELPEGSIVATDIYVWIKASRAGVAPWSRTGTAEAVMDSRIDACLGSGRGRVLRHGYGEEQP